MAKTPMQGEAAHDAGRDGARRAKYWLEATSRVDACWVNPDEGARQKLTFAWPEGGQTFSFDLGGRLRYAELDGQLFFAEVKNYTTSSKLPGYYREFLAKCYVAYEANPAFADNFMWVSWTPHGTSKWADLTSASMVRESVIEQAKRIFPADVDPESAVDDDACARVSERLWLLILSKRQELLVPSRENLALIHSHETIKASA